MRATPALLLIALAGCQTVAPAVTREAKLPADTRPECVRRCDELGMRVAAIVLIRDSAGCVCEPREPAAAQEGPAPHGMALPGGSAAISGGALIVAMEEAEEEARRRREEEAAAARRREEEEKRRRETQPFHAPGTTPGL